MNQQIKSILEKHLRSQYIEQGGESLIAAIIEICDVQKQECKNEIRQMYEDSMKLNVAYKAGLYAAELLITTNIANPKTETNEG